MFWNLISAIALIFFYAQVVLGWSEFDAQVEERAVFHRNDGACNEDNAYRAVEGYERTGDAQFCTHLLAPGTCVTAPNRIGDYGTERLSSACSCLVKTTSNTPSSTSSTIPTITQPPTTTDSSTDTMTMTSTSDESTTTDNGGGRGGPRGTRKARSLRNGAHLGRAGMAAYQAEKAKKRSGDL